MTLIAIKKNFLMREFKLTSREYCARFITAARNQDETHALFATRLKSSPPPKKKVDDLFSRRYV